jgi:hypothetical protein
VSHGGRLDGRALGAITYFGSNACHSARASWASKGDTRDDHSLQIGKSAQNFSCWDCASCHLGGTIAGASSDARAGGCFRRSLRSDSRPAVAGQNLRLVTAAGMN